MKIVKNMKDLEQLTKKRLLSVSLIEHLKEYMVDLHQSLEHDCKLKDFTLEEHGYLVILEAKDDVRNLEEVGLNAEDGGLLGSYPEWVEQKNLSDESWIYQIAILYNNETMMMFYILPETFDNEVETWLKQLAGIN